MFMKNRPKIGITMRLDLETNRFYLGRDYSEALENFGAIPIHISLIPKKEYIVETLKTLDGILLPGSNSDIDPLIYGEEPLPKCGQIIPEKDETDLLVLSEAEKLKMPILAICFGMQALNVSRGGTLFQDINSQVENSLKHEQGKPIKRNSHSLEIKEEKTILSLITTKTVTVNSSHHQSIKNLGNNLVVTSLAKDGVIESIEDSREDRFILGVQWHPELSWKFDDLSKNIFKIFVNKCWEFNLRKK
jgi:putative glutamine amidotransferase